MTNKKNVKISVEKPIADYLCSMKKYGDSYSDVLRSLFKKAKLPLDNELY